MTKRAAALTQNRKQLLDKKKRCTHVDGEHLIEGFDDVIQSSHHHAALAIKMSRRFAHYAADLFGDLCEPSVADRSAAMHRRGPSFADLSDYGVSFGGAAAI